MADNLRSEFTEVTLELIDEIRGLREEFRKSPAPPFMEERVSGEQFRRRWQTMVPQSRMKLIERLGSERVLRLLTPGGELPS